MTLALILGITIILGLVLLLIREIRRTPDPPAGRISPEWKKRIRIAFVLVLLVLASLGCYVTLIEPNRLVIHSETIQIDNWPKDLAGLRIAVVSDIHTGAPFINDQKLREIVDRTNALNPDLIVLLGDYISPDSWHSHRVLPEVTAAGFKDLKAPLGVYSVLGNHDWWYNGERVRRAFEQNGIHVLEDDVAEIKWHEKSFWLVGLADLWTRPQHINETIARVPAGSTIIALTHNPDIFPKLPQSVPLLVAGHTHGGQVNFPLVGTPIVPSRYGAKYTAGHLYENGHHLFVTTGIGTSILPVRFRVPPEIVLLTLVGSK